jgi:hypothetical protein
LLGLGLLIAAAAGRHSAKAPLGGSWRLLRSCGNRADVVGRSENDLAGRGLRLRLGLRRRLGGRGRTNGSACERQSSNQDEADEHDRLLRIRLPSDPRAMLSLRLL